MIALENIRYLIESSPTQFIGPTPVQTILGSTATDNKHISHGRGSASKNCE